MRRAHLCLSLLAVLAATFVLPAAASARSTQSTLFEAPRELLGDDPALRASTAQEVKGLGADWVRIILYWNAVAPDPNGSSVPAFDERAAAGYPGLARYDAAIAAARAAGLRVLVTVSGPVPRWATAAKRDQRTRPSATRFGRFTQMLGRHYGAQVDAWSVWNEPNHPQFLLPQFTKQGTTRVYTAAKLYRQLFQQGEAGLTRGGVRAPILLGETAPRGTATAVAPLAFLRTALCLDAKYRKRSSCGRLKADGYAHHAYTTRGGPFFIPPGRDDVTIGALSRLNRALAKAEKAKALPRGTDVWLTEFGIQSWPDTRLGVSPQQQAEYRSLSEHLAYRNGRVRMFSQYLMRDDTPRPGSRNPAPQRIRIRSARARRRRQAVVRGLPVAARRHARPARDDAVGHRPAQRRRDHGDGRLPQRQQRAVATAEDRPHQHARCVEHHDERVGLPPVPRALDCAGRPDVHRATDALVSRAVVSGAGAART